MGNKKSKKDTPRSSREIFALTSERTAAVRRGIAIKAVESLESTSDVIKRYTPGNFAELIHRWVPFTDPATFARLIKRQMDYYTTITEGREMTPFERIAHSEITLTLADGTDIAVRPPLDEELDSLRSLYGEGLTAEDREARFFRDLPAERAAREGSRCSSLMMPESAVDLVAVTEDGTLIAHSGYVAESAHASLHISVHKDWRMRTDSGERLSEIMFSRTTATALLDPRILEVSAETLPTNHKVNRLVRDTMHPRGAEFYDDDGINTTTITKMIDDEQ